MKISFTFRLAGLALIKGVRDMRLKGIGLTVLVVCLGGLAVAAGYGRGAADRRRVPDRGVPYTLRSVVTHYSPDGTVRATSDKTRYESSDGTFRIVTVTDGVVRVASHQAGRGFFVVNDANRLLLRDPISGPHRDTLAGASPDELARSPEFDRTEQLLGRTAYVLRHRDAETGVVFAENWVIPEFGNVPIKSVEYDRINGRLLSVGEPITITPVEPDPADLRLPDYSVKETPARRR